jgi:acyl-CoA synthetase (AMP-forming)/AMP-acid ligase II
MFKDIGIRRGDTVGVLIGTGGEARYPAFWLGLSYLGAPVALLPPQLRSSALIHSIKVAKVTAILYSHHLCEGIQLF